MISSILNRMFVAKSFVRMMTKRKNSAVVYLMENLIGAKPLGMGDDLDNHSYGPTGPHPAF